MRIITDMLAVTGAVTVAVAVSAAVYFWDDINPKRFIPDRAKEQYTVSPLSNTTFEHYRFIRNGRYVTVCYWISDKPEKVRAIATHPVCSTHMEYFNGY